MPLTRKGSEILQAMQREYGAKKGTSVFYASANKGTISGVHQTHHQPVTNSPFHSLRPPAPEGANKAGDKDYIPAGRRGVLRHTSEIADKSPPGHMQKATAAHQRLAHEVASGLRKFTFKQVARQQPAQL